MCLPWSDHPWWWALRQLPTLDDPFSRPLCDPLWIKTKHWVRLYDVTYMSMSLRFGFELNLWKSWLINKLFISCGLVHYILKILKSKPHGMCKFNYGNQDYSPWANGIYFIAIISKTPLYFWNRPITDLITEMGVAQILGQSLLASLLHATLSSPCKEIFFERIRLLTTRMLNGYFIKNNGQMNYVLSSQTRLLRLGAFILKQHIHVWNSGCLSGI